MIYAVKLKYLLMKNKVTDMSVLDMCIPLGM